MGLDVHQVEITFLGASTLAEPERHRAALATLSADERERVERFHTERDRRLHAAARALLRRRLAHHLAIAVADLKFTQNAYGRPELAAPTSSLRFNVSHTAGLVMVGVAVGVDIGVDVEGVPGAVPADVVERSFSAGERALVWTAARDLQPERFATLWTLKESYVKARGLGLSLSFDEFAFALDPPRLCVGEDVGLVQAAVLSATPTHRAAVCVLRSPSPPIQFVIRWDD